MALLALQDSQYFRAANDFGRKTLAAGNGIFGCGDGRLNSGEETGDVRRDQKVATKPAKIPAETAYPESASGILVWKDWMVVDAVGFEPANLPVFPVFFPVVRKFEFGVRILKQDPAILFDQEAIRRKARPGDLYFDNTDPVLLTIVSGEQTTKEGSTETPPCAICRGMQHVSKFLKQEAARSWTLHELVTPAHALLFQLSTARPRKRGRSG